jgi:hypothetical protein
LKPRQLDAEVALLKSVSKRRSLDDALWFGRQCQGNPSAPTKVEFDALYAFRLEGRHLEHPQARGIPTLIVFDH